MPFEVKCDKCDAKFALTEDLYTRKVKGRVVTIKCKSCRAGIQVDGTVMADDSPPGQTPTVPLAGPGMLKSSGNELEPTPTVPLSLGGGSDDQADDLWLISFGDDDDREMSSGQIADALLKGTIDEETIVWRDGMDDWLPLSAVAELRLAVSQAQRAQATGGFLGTGMSLGKKADSPPDSEEEAPISIEPESLNPDSVEEITSSGAVALAPGTMGKSPDPPRPPPARNVPGGTKVGLPVPPEIKKSEGKREFPKPPAMKKAEPKKAELPKPPAPGKGAKKPEPAKPAPPPRKMPEPPKPPSPTASASDANNDESPKPALPKPPPLKKRGDDAGPKPPKPPALKSLAGTKTEDSERVGEDVLGLATSTGESVTAARGQGVDLAELGNEAPPEPVDDGPEETKKEEESKEAAPEKRPAMVATAAEADAPVAVEPAEEKKKGPSAVLLIGIAAAVAFGVYWFGMRTTDGPVAVNTPAETSEVPPENPSSPTEEPTAEPTTEPSEEPTEEPSEEPSEPASPSEPSRLLGTSGGSTPPSTGDPVAPAVPDKPEKPEAPEKPAPEPDKPSKPEPSAPAPGSDPPKTPDKPKGGENPFDKGAAAAALGSAAAQASGCRKASDPSGRARVTVTFAPSGRVTNAVVSGPPFAGTPTGGCIAATMRRARIPPFSGGAKTVGKTVVIN